VRVTVTLKPDYLERIASRKSPLAAVAELIWNALDGDATRVEVRTILNDLGGLQAVQVSDNGHGIEYDQAVHAFGSLGDSWKRRAHQSPRGRRLHGRAGEGRFSVFAIGRVVEWQTRWKSDATGQAYEIRGLADDVGTFEITDPVSADAPTTGTTVIIAEPLRHFTSLIGDTARQRLAELFALYLRQYPGVEIVYDGVRIDPATVEQHCEEYEVPEVTAEDGRRLTAQLTVIEWTHRVERALFLCDAGGFALAWRPVGIHAPGYDFTAYLKSEFVRDCEQDHVLELDEMHPDLSRLVDSAKGVLRDHFRRRMASDAQAVVEAWKTQAIYPYQGLPRDTVEEVERQVFDVVALNVNQYLPDFATADPKSKRLSFRMLRTAIERSPQDVRRIIQEVLDLPKEKQEELAWLLERTTLSAIINASKLVGDRLEFLQGLETLVFDPDQKKGVLERKHLHRLVAENTWLFGEQYHLTVDDQSLTEVLRRHLHLLGDEVVLLDDPVTVGDGSPGIVDLMLSRRVPHSRRDQLDHLVVELKRPTQRIDGDVVAQTEKYAHAVARDPRFGETRAHWTFWSLSSEIHDAVRWKVSHQSDRPDGLLVKLERPSLEIWVKTWGEVIESARARLRFFEETLEYMATHDTGLAYLRQTYAKYLPSPRA